MIVVTCAAAAACGCGDPAKPRSVRSEYLTVKIPAIKEAARAKDLTAAPQLVKDLESDDAAVRMFAILGLQEMSGQDFGYVYYADRERRKPAVMKWQQWLQQQGPATRPARR